MVSGKGQYHQQQLLVANEEHLCITNQLVIPVIIFITHKKLQNLLKYCLPSTGKISKKI